MVQEKNGKIKHIFCVSVFLVKSIRTNILLAVKCDFDKKIQMLSYCPRKLILTLNFNLTKSDKKDCVMLKKLHKEWMAWYKKKME